MREEPIQLSILFGNGFIRIDRYFAAFSKVML